MKRPSRIPPARPNQHRQASLVQKVFAQVTALYQSNQYTQALELCRSKLLKLAPSHPCGLLYAGVISYLSNDLQESEHYLKAAAAAGNSFDAYTNLGLTLAAMHRLPEAESAYRRAVALNPRAAQAWNNLGNILKNSFKTERRQEALECYRRAIAANPGYANAHNNLGHALDSIQGDKAGAEESFRAAIAYDPNYLQAHLNLADILERSGRPDEALTSLRQALVLQPNNFQVIGRALGLRRGLADWDERLPGRAAAGQFQRVPAFESARLAGNRRSHPVPPGGSVWPHPLGRCAGGAAHGFHGCQRPQRAPAGGVSVGGLPQSPGGSSGHPGHRRPRPGEFRSVPVCLRPGGG